MFSYIGTGCCTPAWGQGLLGASPSWALRPGGDAGPQGGTMPTGQKPGGFQAGGALALSGRWATPLAASEDPRS